MTLYRHLVFPFVAAFSHFLMLSKTCSRPQISLKNERALFQVNITGVDSVT